MGSGGTGRSLEETPTWAVAVVCFLLVLVSILIEHSIHLVGEWLTKKHKRALREALEKLKSELMLLGFISLLLSVGAELISEVCISESLGRTMLPCKKQKNSVYEEGGKGGERKVSKGQIVGRKLLWSEAPEVDLRRILAGGGGSSDKCAAKGKVPLISSNAINQLHIFIFVLAVSHVIYCITTMALGRAKMRRWKVWEQECNTMEYHSSHDPERFRFARETTFGRRHMHSWSRIPVLIWIVCFFRQFVRSVPKVDYQTLRHGFIMAHLAPNSTKKFDFLKYIKRSLEEDFKVVVGISPAIWFFAVLFLLSYTLGWRSYYWLPFIPLVIILLVGTKLQVVITRMAVEIQGEGDVIKGVPTVHPADHLFWFNRPRLILHIIHFVLFQNAFQLAFFVWAWYEFGLYSCFHEQKSDIIIRLSMGILIQILCSYVTLPLYALVTQMGSSMRPTIFNESVANALRRWHNAARKHIKESRKLPPSAPGSTISPATTPGRGSSLPSPLSPRYLLRSGRSVWDSSRMSPSVGKLDRQEANRSSASLSNRSTNHTRLDEGSSFHHHRRHDEVEQIPSPRNERVLRKIELSAAAQQFHEVDLDSKVEFSFERSGLRTEISSGGSS